MKTLLALAAIAALTAVIAFYSSFCPSRSFAIGSVMGVSGSAACYEEDIRRAREENPTEQVLKGGI